MRSLIGRRWLFRGAVAVLGAVVAVYALAPLARHDPEIARLDRVMAQLASDASPKARPLYLETWQVAHDLLGDFRDDAEALDAVARLYQRFNYGEDAIGCWERSIALDPDSKAAAHAAIASVAFDTGDFARAAEHYRKAAEQDPASPTYPVNLGEALIDQGKPEEAVRVLEQNLKRRPWSMPTAALLGQAYLQLRQYDKARRYLESSVRTGPDYPAAYHGLATAYAQLGEKEKAQEYYKKFQELHLRRVQRDRREANAKDDMAWLRQTVARTYADAARVYIVRGEAQAGESRLLRARELAPNGSPWLLMLATLYEQQGRLEEALATLADASQRAPREFSTQLSVAFAYSRLGSNDKAEDAYRRAIALAPHQGSAYAALAEFYLQAGRKLPEAKNLAQKAVEFEPACEYWFLLSQACLRSGDRKAARRAIEHAVALDPGNDAFRRFREQLQREP